MTKFTMFGITKDGRCIRLAEARVEDGETVADVQEREPEMDEFQSRVRDLVKAGFAEREIVEKTGRTRHQVRQAKAAIRDHATKSGALT